MLACSAFCLTFWFRFSFTFDFLVPGKADRTNFGVPLTWGEFVAMRGKGRLEDDPKYESERVPDALFWSPGYHATHLSSSEYGDTVDQILSSWRAALVPEHNMPPVHLMLNMM